MNTNEQRTRDARTTMSKGYQDAPEKPEDPRVLEALASGHNQAELDQLRAAAEKITLSPTMRLRLGYLEEAAKASEKLQAQGGAQG